MRIDIWESGSFRNGNIRYVGFKDTDTIPNENDIVEYLYRKYKVSRVTLKKDAAELLVNKWK